MIDSAPVRILPGDWVPWFTARTSTNPQFKFDTVAGRYVVLTFVPSAADPAAAALLDGFRGNGRVFDDAHASHFTVTADPADEAAQRLPQILPGRRTFFDPEHEVARQFGVTADTMVSYLISPRLQVMGMVNDAEPSQHVATILGMLKALPPVGAIGHVLGEAPVIIIPGVFEPALCDRLIQLYEDQGGVISGFMREEEGKTVARHDANHKVRRDAMVEDPELIGQIQARIMRRVVPAIQRAFQFQVTRMERYLVACYDATEKGHFNPHRDNTTKGTAHRRFACSLNLNPEDYEGGDLRFPEFGPRTYRPPKGACVIFSCSMLHEATLVTRGKRYAFLPFLYDEAARKIRDENLPYLAVAS